MFRKGSCGSVLLAVACIGAGMSVFPQEVPSYEIPSGQRGVDTAPVDTPPSTSAVPVIRGYSLASEVDIHPVPMEGLSLEARLPEFVVFFANTGAARLPWEFRYRLDYSGEDWTETTGRLAHYRNLRPGQYHFEVQTRLPGQPWSMQTAALAIKQRAFFYQTWTFYLIVTAGLFALVMVILRQRDLLLKGQIGLVLEERNRIASDCHDTLMAGFAAISWQMEATARMFEAESSVDSRAAESLELARKMVTHCQAEARRIIWNLRDSDEVIEGLPNALARAVNAIAPAVGVRLNLSVEGDEFPVNPGAVHHLVCIGQEAITNALRHASPSEVEVRLRYEADSLRLTVRDNGSGFPAAKPSSTVGHFGIAMMEERARKLRGSLRFRRLREEVTEVSVTLGSLDVGSPARDGLVVPWIGV